MIPIACSRFSKDQERRESELVDLDRILPINELLNDAVSRFCRATTLDVHRLEGVCDGAGDRNFGYIVLRSEARMQRTYNEVHDLEETDVVTDDSR